MKHLKWAFKNLLKSIIAKWDITTYITAGSIFARSIITKSVFVRNIIARTEMPDPILLTQWIMKAIRWAFWHRSSWPRCSRCNNCRLWNYWTSNIKALSTRKRIESLIQVSQFLVFFFVSLKEKNPEYVFNGGFKKGFLKWWCSFVAEVKIFLARFWGNFPLTIFWRRPFAVVERKSGFLPFKSYIFDLQI